MVLSDVTKDTAIFEFYNRGLTSSVSFSSLLLYSNFPSKIAVLLTNGLSQLSKKDTIAQYMYCEQIYGDKNHLLFY